MEQVTFPHPRSTVRTVVNAIIRMSVTYYHQLLGAAHPDHKEVIPICPEPITRRDGATKNDCEKNVMLML